jgi:hypothetical protein
LYLPRKKMLLTENDVQPNREGSDHVLLMMIDVGLGPSE